jgi:hypothetical protein
LTRASNAGFFDKRDGLPARAVIAAAAQPSVIARVVLPLINSERVQSMIESSNCASNDIIYLCSPSA